MSTTKQVFTESLYIFLMLTACTCSNYLRAQVKEVLRIDSVIIQECNTLLIEGFYNKSNHLVFRAGDKYFDGDGRLLLEDSDDIGYIYFNDTTVLYTKRIGGLAEVYQDGTEHHISGIYNRVKIISPNHFQVFITNSLPAIVSLVSEDNVLLNKWHTTEDYLSDYRVIKNKVVNFKKNSFVYVLDENNEIHNQSIYSFVGDPQNSYKKLRVNPGAYWILNSDLTKKLECSSIIELEEYCLCRVKGKRFKVVDKQGNLIKSVPPILIRLGDSLFYNNENSNVNLYKWDSLVFQEEGRLNNYNQYYFSFYNDKKVHLYSRKDYSLVTIEDYARPFQNYYFSRTADTMKVWYKQEKVYEGLIMDVRGLWGDSRLVLQNTERQKMILSPNGQLDTIPPHVGIVQERYGENRFYAYDIKRDHILLDVNGEKYRMKTAKRLDFTSGKKFLMVTHENNRSSVIDLRKKKIVLENVRYPRHYHEAGQDFFITGHRIDMTLYRVY